MANISCQTSPLSRLHERVRARLTFKLKVKIKCKFHIDGPPFWSLAVKSRRRALCKRRWLSRWDYPVKLVSFVDDGIIPWISLKIDTFLKILQPCTFPATHPSSILIEFKLFNHQLHPASTQTPRHHCQICPAHPSALSSSVVGLNLSGDLM